ncbi:MAG: hypothetical protein AAFV07_12405 [Bacteroidota bacterium]
MQFPSPIWYVDDNEADILLAQIIFEELCPDIPLQVFNSLDRFEAHLADWQASNAPSPMFVLMDLHFPNGYAWDTISKVRGRFSAHELPVYLFSASYDPQVPFRAKSMGVNQFYRKQIGFQQNLDFFRDLLALPSVA